MCVTDMWDLLMCRGQVSQFLPSSPYRLCQTDIPIGRVGLGTTPSVVCLACQIETKWTKN